MAKPTKSKTKTSTAKINKPKAPQFKFGTALLLSTTLFFFLIACLLGTMLYYKYKENFKILADTDSLKEFMQDQDQQLKTCQGDLEALNTNFEEFKSGKPTLPAAP